MWMLGLMRTARLGWREFRDAVICRDCSKFYGNVGMRHPALSIKELRNSMTAALVRRCPNCQAERPASEPMCEGIRDGEACGWPLFEVPPTRAGEERPPDPVPP